jgi:hypothetical protein
MAHLYRDHPDYGGEVDHVELLRRLVGEYDGWWLHTASTTLHVVLDAAERAGAQYRVASWVKPFASFKPNNPLAYAWEPIVLSPARPALIGGPVIMRDWIEAPAETLVGGDCVREGITLRRGFVGAKPERVTRWALQACGVEPDDEFDDMFPGSGAITRAWEQWRAGGAGVLDGDGQLWSDDG